MNEDSEFTSCIEAQLMPVELLQYMQNGALLRSAVLDVTNDMIPVWWWRRWLQSVLFVDSRWATLTKRWKIWSRTTSASLARSRGPVHMANQLSSYIQRTAMGPLWNWNRHNDKCVPPQRYIVTSAECVIADSIGRICCCYIYPIVSLKDSLYICITVLLQENGEICCFITRTKTQWLFVDKCIIIDLFAEDLGELAPVNWQRLWNGLCN